MGRYRALLVANSKFYADPERLPELKAPIYDMARLQDALIHPDLGLFDREQVQLLPNARCSDVLLSMEDFFQSGEPEDTMLLYYSGHGQLDINNNFFLCASDTRMDRLMATGIRDDQVNGMMRGSPARTFVLILDCCSSGAWKSPAELLPDALRGSGRFLLSSSRAGQNSGDAGVETESSAFTKLLVEAMEEADLDTDQDGYVDIDEIYKHVERNLRVTGQQAQRDFGKSARSVALARRPRVATETAPIATEPVGPHEPPSLTVTPEQLQVTARLDELPVTERIYVFNRGGGSISWSAESDDPWIKLEPHDEFVRVSLSPSSEGTHRGSIYVRQPGGNVKQVRVSIAVEGGGEDGAEPLDGAALGGRDAARPLVGGRRTKQPVRRRTVLIGSLVALLAASVVAVILALGAADGPEDGRQTGPSVSDGDAPEQAYLNWKQASLDQGAGPSSVNAITHSEATDGQGIQYVAAGSRGSQGSIWRLQDSVWTGEDLGGGPSTVNGVIPRGTSLVAVGWAGSAADRDASVWTIPLDPSEAGTVEPEIVSAAGRQYMNKVGQLPGGGLVAVGRDRMRGGVWISRDEETWDRVPFPPGTAELRRARNIPLAPDGPTVLFAVGFVEEGGDRDAAVWRTDASDGSERWRLLTRFRQPGDQEILDVISGAAGELVAVGSTTSDDGTERDAVVWRSIDGGVTWTTPSPAVLGGPGDQVINRVIVAKEPDAPFRFIAGGSEAIDGDVNAALWYSADGVTWLKQKVEETPLAGDGPQVIYSLDFDPSAGSSGSPTVLAVGSDSGVAAIWEGNAQET